MVLALFLLGCSGLSASAPVGPPALRTVEPADSAWVSDTTVRVQGHANGIAEVLVNDGSAAVSGSVWSRELELDVGIQDIEIEAVDEEGGTWHERRTILVGETAEAPEAGRRAVSVHLDPWTLDDLTPLLASLIDPTALLAGVGGGGPLYDDGDTAVYLGGVEVPNLTISALPQSGSVEVILAMPGLHLPLEIETELWFIDIDLDAHIRMDQAWIAGDLAIDAVDGDLQVELDDVRVHVDGVELDVDGVADFLEDLVISDQQAEELLQANLDPLAAAIPGLVDDLVGDIERLGLEIELLDTPLAADVRFAEAAVTPEGIDLVLALNVEAGDAAPGPSLAVGVPEVTAEGLAIGISDDALNHALAQLWRAGALDLELPLEPGTIDALILGVFGGDPALGGELALQCDLPPVVVGRFGEARLQLGACTMAIQTPGGEYGEVVTAGLSADTALGFEIEPTDVGLTLSDAKIALHPVGENAAVVAPRLEEMEAAVRASMGVLADLLSFPLDGLGPQGLDLGESLAITTTRDPSDRSTVLQVALSDP